MVAQPGRLGLRFGFDDVGNDAPDAGIVVLVELDVGEVGVGRAEEGPPFPEMEVLDGEAAVDPGEDEGTGAGAEGAVDEDEISVSESGIAHGFAADACEEGGGGVADEFAGEIDALLQVVGRGGGEAGGDRAGCEGEGCGGRGLRQAGEGEGGGVHYACIGYMRTVFKVKFGCTARGSG